MSYNSVSDNNFPCLEIGGMEFPVIDMYNSLMYEYDHYWSNGFGTTLPDRYKNSWITGMRTMNTYVYIFRIFHIQKSTEKRWVYKIEGYTCSEPIFVKNPQLGLDDDEGVVLTLMTPIYDDLR